MLYCLYVMMCGREGVRVLSAGHVSYECYCNEKELKVT